MDVEGLGRKLLLTPSGDLRRAPEKQTVGTVTASCKMLRLQALSSSLNASTAKRGCLGRGEAFGALRQSVPQNGRVHLRIIDRTEGNNAQKKGNPRRAKTRNSQNTWKRKTGIVFPELRSVAHHCCYHPCCANSVAANPRKFRDVAEVSYQSPIAPAKKPVSPILLPPCHCVAGDVPCKNGSRYTGV